MNKFLNEKIYNQVIHALDLWVKFSIYKNKNQILNLGFNDNFFLGIIISLFSLS